MTEFEKLSDSCDLKPRLRSLAQNLKLKKQNPLINVKSCIINSKL